MFLEPLGDLTPRSLHTPTETSPPDPCPAVLIDVVFKAHFSAHNSSKHLAVVGGHPLLGEWDVSRALGLEETQHVDRQGKTVWRGTITMPLDSTAEYKLIIVDGSSKVLWEGGPNRHVSVAAVTGHVSFVPDSYDVDASFQEAEFGGAGAESLGHKVVTLMPFNVCTRVQ